MNIDKLQSDLERDEGEVLHAYTDSEGYITIGVGRLIDQRRGGGISKSEARYLLNNDIQNVLGELDDAIGWWRRLNEPRQRALANMAFNLGVPGLLKFNNMLHALRAGNWSLAHDEALNSRWAGQVGERAQRIADVFLKGE